MLAALSRDVELSAQNLEELRRQVGSQGASAEAIHEQLTHVLAALPRGAESVADAIVSWPLVNRNAGADSHKDPHASAMDLTGYEDLVRELSHSLGSPLALIEAVASVVIDQRDGDADSLQSVLDAVAICKAFVYAFRRLGDVADAAAGWSPASWRDAMVASAAVYGRRSNSSVGLATNLPDALDGYSNSYLTALVLPLLENAIEAGVPGSSVDIALESAGDWNLIRVAGTPRLMPPLDRMYERGFSTKENHEGIGLDVVRRLLSAYGRELRHEVDGGQLTFVLTLPRRIG